MSSMWRAAVIVPVLLAIAPSSSAQYARAAGYCLRRAYLRRASLRRSTQWRALRQSSGYRFADYARFLIANPRLAGRSADARLGREGDAAGRERRPRSSPSSPADKPKTGNGWARLADAYAATRADG